MSFERYKTQVLLLHSEQNTLDALSAGFNDDYCVHCETSGADALTTLGDTSIHVIVAAQDLPGMSGLDALREARKRSPETFGILLAGADEDGNLAARVGDKEGIRIVRGTVTPELLLQLVESAIREILGRTTSGFVINPAAPLEDSVFEHIVVETSEYGKTIISDGNRRRLPRTGSRAPQRVISPNEPGCITP